MNVCALDFPDESFNTVIDKGTLDSVLCGEGSTANVAKMCMEISRVLKPNGVYFICSYGVPYNRLQVRQEKGRESCLSETRWPRSASVCACRQGGVAPAVCGVRRVSTLRLLCLPSDGMYLPFSCGFFLDLPFSASDVSRFWESVDFGSSRVV